MSSWKSSLFCALVKQEIDKVEAILSDGNIPKENITIQYAEDCSTCFGNLEFPVNPVQQNVDFILNELKQMIDAGRCACLKLPVGHDSCGVIQSVSLLHLACLYGPISLVKRLLQADYNVHEQSLVAGFTPLHYLSQSDVITSDDVVEIAELLLAVGADVNVQDKHKNLALHLAIENHHTKLALLLIERGSLIDVVSDTGETPLLIAAKKSEEEVLVRLCELKADPNITDHNQMLALNIAIERRNKTMIKAILRNPLVNPNEHGVCRHGYRRMSAILLATSSGYADIVGMLLEHGASPDRIDKDDHQPLLIAAFTNNVDIARLLITHHADVNATEHSGYSPIHHAAWEGHTEMVRILLEAGAHSDNQTHDRNTPLSLACHGNFLKTITLLLDQKTNVNNQDKDLDMPLHYTTYNGNMEASQMLLSRGAKPDMENAFRVTPLWNAVYAKSLNLVQLLIQCNVRLNVLSKGINQHADTNHPSIIFSEPRTPLYIACMGDWKIARMLVLAGVNLSDEEWFWNGDLPKELCSNQSFHDWICQEASNPPSLLRQARRVIRSILGVYPQSKVQTLPITDVMKDYLVIKSFHADL